MPLVSGLVLEKSSAVGNSSKVTVFHVKWLNSVLVEVVFLTATNRINTRMACLKNRGLLLPLGEIDMLHGGM